MASGSDRNSIALSIYHSVPELHEDETLRCQAAATNGSSAVDKVGEFFFGGHMSFVNIFYYFTFTLSS